MQCCQLLEWHAVQCGSNCMANTCCSVLHAHHLLPWLLAHLKKLEHVLRTDTTLTWLQASNDGDTAMMLYCRQMPPASEAATVLLSAAVVGA